MKTKSIVPERVTSWMNTWLSTEKRRGPGKIETLAGDGSVRVFYRVMLPDCTLILLCDPGWILSKDYATHQGYLASRKIPVPAFLAVDIEAGFGVMEDLGDELLQHRLNDLDDNPTQQFLWLKEAAELLARLHGETFPVPADLPVSSRRFDTQKYFDELQFTFEHLQQKFLGLPAPTATQLAEVKKYCETLDKFKPDVFAHRDYHTRNLLIMDEKLFMIDFQDARLGPIHYDLASLLYDAYVPITDEDKRALIDAYRTALKKYALGYF
jgi:aminoglycoside/choline kinase family phosphotransferase